MVDDGFHTLHKAVGVPVVAVMNKEPNADCQCHALV